MKRNLLLALIIGLGATALMVSFWGSGDAWKELKNVEPIFLMVLSLNFLGIVLVDALRTKILLKDVPFGTCVANSLWGFYVGAITPFAAGGQPFQIYHLTKAGIPFEKSASAVAVRFFSSFSFSIISGFVFFMVYLDTFEELGILGDLFFAGIVLALLFYVFIILLSFSKGFLRRFFMSRLVLKIFTFFSRKSEDDLKRLVEERILGYVSATREFWRASKLKFLAVAILSGLMVVLIHTSTYFAMKAVNRNVNVSLFQVVSIQLALSLIVYFAPTPGASGATELAYYVVYSNIIEKTDAMVSMLVWRFFNYYLFIILGILLGLGRLTKKPEGKSSG